MATESPATGEVEQLQNECMMLRMTLRFLIAELSRAPATGDAVQAAAGKVRQEMAGWVYADDDEPGFKENSARLSQVARELFGPLLK